MVLQRERSRGSLCLIYFSAISGGGFIPARLTGILARAYRAEIELLINT